ncbi:MAG: NAD(P)/FAD-dependent oxidoreductase [Deltaproteobacteria bacterium]|nr:NAD(P)/FAD-dependent oxidoreductase [Deltaproteobacteria bacterium]
MSYDFDAIVVGARCAGSPTAMLLARTGYKVLVVDRAAFPSDTISTHVVHPTAVAALKRWGLLDRLIATGCPAIDTYMFDFGPIVITGSPGTTESPVAYCPRRTVLDKILVDAAVDAGAQIYEGFVVDELVTDGDRVTGIRGHRKDGPSVTITARVVIGADGRNSVVAKGVQPVEYNQKPQFVCAYYSYWRDLPMHGRFETYARQDHGFAACETHDGLTMVVGGWPFARFEAQKQDLDAAYLRLFDQAPAFKAKIEKATRIDKVYGAVTPNAFRKPFGPGWALVGDAGYIKDPITAQGILDAFRDAELLAGGLDQVFSGASTCDDAMAHYQATRDAIAMPMYELTAQIASMAPPPPEFQQLLGAVSHNQRASDDFCRVNAGGLPPPEFFSEANVGKIFAGV